MGSQTRDRPDLLTPPHLRNRGIPNFPLSSPIHEEVTSPVDGSDYSDPFASPEDKTVRFPQDEHTGNGTMLDVNRESRWSADSGSTRRVGRWNSTKRLVKNNAKKPMKRGRPGLNLVTNLGPPAAPIGPPEQAPGNGKQQPAFEHATNAFLDLKDLKSISNGKDQPAKNKSNGRRLLWRKAAKKGYGQLKEQSQEGLRKPGHRGRQELSPADRPIMIGMSVPHTSFQAERGGNGTDSNRVDVTAQPKDQEPQPEQTPITPSIVITPARESHPWGMDMNGDNEVATPARPPRPPSSVYSRYTHRAKSPIGETIPPVPALPTGAYFSNSSQSDDVFNDNQPAATQRHRALSTGTVFEDDDHDSPSSPSQRPRSVSEGRQRMFSGLSLDTITPRRRSQGWWNYLLSPLLSRSNTLSSRTPHSAGSPPPPLPSPLSRQRSAGSSEKEYISEVSTFSPDTPETADREKTMRSDITRWPDWHSVRDNANSGSPKSAAERKISPTSAVSSQSIPFVMSTPATMPSVPSTARCHACLYDSDTNPFFSSINHTCFKGGNHDQGSSPSPTHHDTTRGALNSSDSNTNNPFFQRFAASLRNDNATRPRSDSESTTFEDEDVSPTVREANLAPIVRADGASLAPTPVTNRPSPNVSSASSAVTPTLPDPPSSWSQPPPYSPLHGTKSKAVPRYRAILPPGQHVQSQQPYSPEPITPGTGNMISGSGHAMEEHPRLPPSAYLGADDLPRRPRSSVTLFGFEPDTRVANETRRQRLEREDTYGRKAGGMWRGRGCFSSKGCFGRPGREGRNRRRWWVVGVVIAIILIALGVGLTVFFLTKQGEPAPVETETRWLNLTGYPPMPTGISTVAGPELATSRSGCVQPSTMWACALPKDQHEANKPHDPDRPNFRIQIAFQNGSFEHSTEEVSGSENVKRAVNQFKRQNVEPNPAPPSLEDMEFLGNTTDNVTGPDFVGEETPFYASIMSPQLLTELEKVEKRAEKPSPTSSGFPNLASAIPPPTLEPGGSPSPAVLYPQVASQPLRLYDRGLDTEHYGFYTYFDRSIFLKSTEPLSPSSDKKSDNVPDDKSGGSTKSAARVRCTWAQTRFLVKIWTQPEKIGYSLIEGRPTSSEPPEPSATPTGEPAEEGSPLSDSANDFDLPGSFPYPISVTLDRHGGAVKDKMVYCYGIDVRGEVEEDNKKLQLEFRDAGGTLVNPASGLFDFGDGEGNEENEGTQDGVDGGTGGCSCEWKNWINVI